MKKHTYFVRVEGTHFPSIFIDARRFNRLVSLVAPFSNMSVHVMAHTSYDDLISDYDLRIFVEIINYLHKL